MSWQLHHATRKQKVGISQIVKKNHIEALRNFRRNGFSIREIAHLTGWAPATVHKYAGMVVPEVFYEPGLSLDEKVSRYFGPPETPSGVGLTAQSPKVSATISPSSNEDSLVPKKVVVTKTVEIFTGTLPISSWSEPAKIRFMVPRGAQKAVLEFTAQGLPFVVKLYTDEQYSTYYHTDQNTETHKWGPARWIKEELELPHLGPWMLWFQTDLHVDGPNPVEVRASLRITGSNSDPLIWKIRHASAL